MASRDNEFETLFVKHKTKAQELAFKGELQTTSFRFLAWKYFLGVLTGDPKEWATLNEKLRKEYEEKKKSFFVNIEDIDADDSVIDDPLSQSETSAHNTFFKNEELENEIQLDLSRTYPDVEFFQRKKTQTEMKNILFVYAKSHPEVSYRQGMHELVAAIYFSAFEESEKPKPKDGEYAQILSVLCSSEGCEADTYFVFEKLMDNIKEFYMTEKKKDSPRGTVVSDCFDESTPFSIHLHRIQFVLLRSIDTELSDHLKEIEISPQLYLIRWLKCLFVREFHLVDVLALWDAIFAFGDGLVLIDYICIALLLYIREQLLSQDQLGAMKRLMRYPPVESVNVFVEEALYLANPKKFKKPQREQVQVISQPIQQEKKRQIPSQKAKKLTDKEKIAELEKEVHTSHQKLDHIKARIDRIIYSLQQDLSRTGDDETEEKVGEKETKEKPNLISTLVCAISFY